MQPSLFSTLCSNGLPLLFCCDIFSPEAEPFMVSFGILFTTACKVCGAVPSFCFSTLCSNGLLLLYVRVRLSMYTRVGCLLRGLESHRFGTNFGLLFYLVSKLKQRITGLFYRNDYRTLQSYFQFHCYFKLSIQRDYFCCSTVVHYNRTEENAKTLQCFPLEQIASRSWWNSLPKVLSLVFCCDKISSTGELMTLLAILVSVNVM